MNPTDDKDTGAILPDRPGAQAPLTFIIGQITPGSGSIRTLVLSRQDADNPNAHYTTTVSTNDPALASWGAGHQVTITGGAK